MQCDRATFSHFFHAMLADGVYFAPSAFEACFLSAAHGAPEVEKTIRAAKRFFATLNAPHST
jgi:glutamate-1-semialdehyde 2,1-aminomutase